MPRRVVVIHPFVQAYRQSLYRSLADRLADEGSELVVVWNQPSPRLAARGDAIEASWTTRVPARWITLGSREVIVRRLGGLDLGPDDLVIVEQAVKNLETFPLLLGRPKARPRVAMWGHGRSYSVPQPAPVAALKQWLTRRSDWFFAYTDAGARHVVDRGFPAGRVTVLNNTIDTASLTADLASVDDLDAFRERHGLTPGCTALFLGGVDRAKGIHFLLKSALIAADSMPDFRLLVAGTGDDLDAVIALERAGGPVRALGRVEGLAKATALAACDVLAIPEWIGLVAVDSLVAGRPIVSTGHHSHAPEHEYLQDGVTAVFTDHDEVAYAHGLTELLRSTVRLRRMQAACAASSADFSLAATVDAFMDGIHAWEAASRRGG